MRPQRNTHSGRLRFDARYVLGADVDRFMENGNGIELSHSFERHAQIVCVTFRVRRRKSYIDVQTGFLGGAEGSQSLRWRGGFWLIYFGQIVAQGGQAHAEHQAVTKAAE